MYQLIKFCSVCSAKFVTKVDVIVPFFNFLFKFQECMCAGLLHNRYSPEHVLVCRKSCLKGTEITVKTDQKGTKVSLGRGGG